MSEILKKIKDSEKKLFVGIAGPGTGKSTTFKTIIESSDYKSRQILILSFINKLVDGLSEDFKKYDNVKVLTLHAFAKQILGEIDLNPDLDSVISEDYLFINGHNIKYSEKFYEDDLSKGEEEFYIERKEFYKHNKKLYSFNSIIYAVNRLFEKSEDKIPTKYDLILVDEFQDFNKSEYELIKLLNKKSSVVLVGDDNQSLYDFKKANPDQIRSLYHDNSTEEFSLDYCYRCTEVIVDVVNDFIQNVKSRGFLKDSLHKKFLYPKDIEGKNKISRKHRNIDFMPAILGDQLIATLEKKY